jgi:hypothetical protein
MRYRAGWEVHQDAILKLYGLREYHNLCCMQGVFYYFIMFGAALGIVCPFAPLLLLPGLGFICIFMPGYGIVYYRLKAMEAAPERWTVRRRGRSRVRKKREKQPAIVKK